MMNSTARDETGLGIKIRLSLPRVGCNDWLNDSCKNSHLAFAALCRMSKIVVTTFLSVVVLSLPTSVSIKELLAVKSLPGLT